MPLTSLEEKTEEEKEAELREAMARFRLDESRQATALANVPLAAAAGLPKLGMPIRPVLGEFDEPIPQAPPPNIDVAAAKEDVAWEDLSNREKKKIDKLRFEREGDARAAQRALSKATEYDKALEQYLKPIREKHPSPSGLERGLAMATGGITGAASGMFSRGREAKAAIKEGKVKFAKEYERTQRALETVKANKISGRRLQGKLTETQREDLGKITPARWDKVSEWMTPRERALATPKYREEVITGSLGKNPGKSLVAARQLAGMFDDAEEQRDDRKELTMSAAPLYIDPATGAFTDPKNPDGTSKFPQWSSQRTWIMEGILRSQGEVAKDMVGQVRKGMPTARRNLASIGSLLGHGKEGSKMFAASMLGNPNFAQYATDPNGGVKDLPELRGSLSKFKQITGGPFEPSIGNAALIAALNARNSQIATSIANPDMAVEEKNVLLAEHLDNLGELGMLYTQSMVDDAAEVDARIEDLETIKADTKAGKKERTTYLRRMNEKDVDDFEQLVPEDIINSHGGRPTFVQRVTLNKDGRVVVFDKTQDGHREIDSWERVVPNRRHDALTFYMDRVVKTRDTRTNLPRTFSDIKKSILEKPSQTKTDQRGGTLEDVEYFRTHFTELERLRAGDHGPEGGLSGDSRVLLINWVNESPDAHRPELLRKARVLLIPTEYQLKKAGYTWPQWNRLNRKELMFALRKMEKIPMHAPPEAEKVPETEEPPATVIPGLPGVDPMSKPVPVAPVVDPVAPEAKPKDLLPGLIPPDNLAPDARRRVDDMKVGQKFRMGGKAYKKVEGGIIEIEEK